MRLAPGSSPRSASSFARLLWSNRHARSEVCLEAAGLRLGGASETACETRRRSWVVAHSFPGAAESLSDRLSELTPLFEVVNEARDVCQLSPDALP